MRLGVKQKGFASQMGEREGVGCIPTVATQCVRVRT